MDLEADKGLPYFRDPTKFRCRVADGPVFELEKMRQLRSVEFLNAFCNVLSEDKFQKGLKLRVVAGKYVGPACGAVAICVEMA